MAPSHPIEAELTRRFLEFWHTWSQRDEGIVEHAQEQLRPDVSGFGTGLQERYTDRASMVAFLKQGVEEMPKAFTIEWHWVEARLLAPTVGVVEGEATVTLPAGEGERVSFHGRASQVLTLDGQAWRVVHTHGSIPASEQAEGEVMPVDALRARNQELERLVAERTAEIEAARRDAEIEAALERVRSRTMGMKSSDELAKVSLLLDQEVRALGTKTWGCAFNIYGEDASTEWFGSEAGVNHPYPTPREDFFLRYYEKGQAGELFHVEGFEGDDCTAHYDYMCTLPVLGDILARIRAAGHAFPSSQVDHVAYFKYGYLLFITLEPAPEAHDIFQRFARVFEQTYTRYLDLQKAEEQVREAQIEAALERVRSRTMGMRTSDELGEVIQVVFRETLALDVAVLACDLVVLDGETGASTFWVSGQRDTPDEVLHFHLPRLDHPHYAATLAAWKGDAALRQSVLESEACASYMHQLTEAVGDAVPADIGEFLRALPRVVHTEAFTRHGYLRVASQEPLSDEATDTLRRIAHVFEQSYTRFLDLEQAEARAREAQIEAAMERVRSRALAMTTSDELLAVSFTIRREFAGLGLECGAFWHTRYTPDVYQKALTSIDGKKLAAVMELPRDFASNPTLAAWERGEDAIGVFQFNAEAGTQYIAHMIAEGTFSEADPEAITVEMVRAHGGITFVQARTSHGEIGYSLWGEAEPTEEAKDVLVRFTSAFDLAYRRFEDLQQAEADHQALLEEKALTEQALDELRRTQAQLVQQEKLASLGQLTAGIAHEIKNPLNFVTNFADVSGELADEIAEALARGEDPAPLLAELKQTTSVIGQHGRRADGIVKSMMQHARASSGGPEAVDLNKLVAEHAALAHHGRRAQTPGFDVALVEDYDATVGIVSVQPQELGRAVVNLVTNAFDALAEHARRVSAGGDDEAYKPRVTISTERTGDAVAIRVTDNGPGIPDNLRAKIFEPFFTTKPTGGGTGLGLSMSYDIVTQGHGGTLSVEDAPSGGAVFVVRLPAPALPAQP